MKFSDIELTGIALGMFIFGAVLMDVSPLEHTGWALMLAGAAIGVVLGLKSIFKYLDS